MRAKQRSTSSTGVTLPWLMSSAVPWMVGSIAKVSSELKSLPSCLGFWYRIARKQSRSPTDMRQARNQMGDKSLTKVAIIGGSGYTALELIKILLRHPRVEIVAITSRQAETPLISELHPSLYSRLSLRCEPFDPDRLVARGVECAFGCLPHGVSMTTLPALLDRGLRVIDLSADYRLRDPNVYGQWYG